MHGRNVKESDVLIEPGLSINVAAFSSDLTPVGAGSEVVHISRELLRQVRIDELRLRGLVVPEYDLPGVLLRCVIDRQATELRQNLSSNNVCPTCLECCFRDLNVINTVLDNRVDAIVGNGFIPGNIHLHMMQPKVNAKALQALLLRANIVEIPIGQAVRLSEHGSNRVVDELL